MGISQELGKSVRAGRWGLLMGRSWTMLRLGPLQVNVRKGLGTEGTSPGMGTERMASFTCADARTSVNVFDQHGAFAFMRVGLPHCKPN